MTTTQFLLAIFAVLIVGLMLPLSFGLRSALFMALIIAGVLTFIGGGVQYALTLVQ